MRTVLGITAALFVIALAAIVGSRLSDEALAVVIGAICGISATIPVSIALVVAVNQGNCHIDPAPAQDLWYQRQPAASMPQLPATQVVIIVPGENTHGRGDYWRSVAAQYLLNGRPAGPDTPREFKIIGDEQ